MPKRTLIRSDGIFQNWTPRTLFSWPRHQQQPGIQKHRIYSICLKSLELTPPVLTGTLRLCCTVCHWMWQVRIVLPLSSFFSSKWRISFPRRPACVSSRWNECVAEPRRMHSSAFPHEDAHQTAASSLFAPLNWTFLDGAQVRFCHFLGLDIVEIWILNPARGFKSRRGDRLWGTTLQSRLWLLPCVGGMNPINYYSRLNGSVVGKLSSFNLIPNAFVPIALG